MDQFHHSQSLGTGSSAKPVRDFLLLDAIRDIHGSGRDGRTSGSDIVDVCADHTIDHHPT